MKKIFSFIAAVGIALGAVSCSREETPWDEPPSKGAPCTVTFLIETKAAEGIASAGLPDTRISRPILDLNFFVYNDGGLVRSGYMTSPMIPTMKLVPGTYRIYVIANAGISLGQMGEAELLRCATPVTAPDGFVQGEAMYLSGMQTLQVNGPTTCRIVLRRLAAKVDLTVRIADDFKDAYLVHVLPGNAPATCSVFGENRLSASDPQLEFPYADLTPEALRIFSTSYYQYENRAGTVPAITDTRDRIDGKAPAMASYVSIRIRKNGVLYDYKVYLGDNATTDFNVRRNTSYRYEIVIEGSNADDLRISSTGFIFWAGRDYSVGGQRYRDGFHWNMRTAYAELEIFTDNCDPEEEYTVSFRPLSGTFHEDWTMEYMISSLPSAQREYKPIVPGERIAVHKGNGTSGVTFAFSNLESTKNFNTTDNYFEFTLCDRKGWGSTAVLSTNMDEWLK